MNKGKWQDQSFHGFKLKTEYQSSLVHRFLSRMGEIMGIGKRLLHYAAYYDFGSLEQKDLFIYLNLLRGNILMSDN